MTTLSVTTASLLGDAMLAPSSRDGEITVSTIGRTLPCGEVMIAPLWDPHYQTQGRPTMGVGGPMNVRDELRAPDPPFVMNLFSQAQNTATSKKDLL